MICEMNGKHIGSENFDPSYLDLTRCLALHNRLLPAGYHELLG